MYIDVMVVFVGYMVLDSVLDWALNYSWNFIRTQKKTLCNSAKYTWMPTLGRRCNLNIIKSRKVQNDFFCSATWFSLQNVIIVYLRSKFSFYLDYIDICSFFIINHLYDILIFIYLMELIRTRDKYFCFDI